MGQTTLGQQLSAALLMAAVALLAYTGGGVAPRHILIPGIVIVLVGSCGLTFGARPALRTLAGVGLCAAGILAVWTLGSGAWAWASSWATRGEAARMISYAAAFAAGMCWFEHSRARHMLIVATAATTGSICAWSIVRALTSSDPITMFSGYRLDAPIGYANGLAAIAVTGTLLGVAAASSQLDIARQRRLARARYRHHDGKQLALPTRGAFSIGVLAGLAMICTGVLILTQSRAAIASLILGISILIVVHPNRRHIGALLMLTAAGTVAAAPALIDPFRRIGDLTRATWSTPHPPLAPLRDAAISSIHTAVIHTIIAAGAVTIITGAVVAIALRRPEERFVASHDPMNPNARGSSALAPRTIIAVLAVGAALMVIGLALPGRGPIGWSADMISSCSTTPTSQPDRSASTTTSHYADHGTGRCDFWRVAAHDMESAPLRGIGAGNFGDSYAHSGTTGERPTYAHSIALSIGGELGIIGLALAGVMLVATVGGAWTTIRVTPSIAAPEISMLAAVIAWIAHAGVDWLWQLPAVTIPILVLAGSLARGHAVRGAVGSRAVALLGPAALTAAAITVMLSPSLADAAMSRATLQLRAATRTGQTPQQISAHLNLAHTNIMQAQRLAPTSARPWLLKAQLENQSGHPSRARRAILRANQLEPRTRAVIEARSAP